MSDPQQQDPDVRYNLVVFRDAEDPTVAISLTMEQPFVIGAGLKPNVNTAKVSYLELAKLGGTVGRRGQVEFWYTSLPPATDDLDEGGDPADAAADADVVWAGQKIVDVEVLDIGVVLGEDAPRVIEYRLFISDWREAIVPPRGGRVFGGLINDTAAVDAITGLDDALAVFDATKANSDLMAACLKAMKVDYGGSIPAAVDDCPEPLNLKWLGNPAPDELEKLLKRCGATLCPRSDGTARVVMLGGDDEDVVDLAEEFQVIELTGIDRRGKTVVVTSSPKATVDTLTVPSQEEGVDWQFVVKDKAGKWTELSDAGVTAASVRARFTDVEDEENRQHFAETAYCCVQIVYATEQGNPAPPSVVLRELYEQDEDDETQALVGTPWYEAQGFVRRANGTWTNAEEPRRYRIVRIEDAPGGAVVWLDGRVGKLRDGGEHPVDDFEELDHDELNLRLSFEFCRTRSSDAGEDGGDGTTPADPTFEYFNAGYRREVDDVVPIETTEVEAILGIGAAAGGDADTEVRPDGDTLIVSRPELRLVRVRPIPGDPNAEDAPVDVNRDKIEAGAKAVAERLLAKSGQPLRIHLARGFQPIELSGLVAEIAYDQEALTTIVKENAWWAPAAQLLSAERARGGGGAGGEAFPRQAETQASITAAGSAGGQQPSVGVSRGAPVEIPALSMTPCRVQQNGGSPGTTATSCTLTYDLYKLDNTTKINTTGGPVSPKGPPRLGNVIYTAATRAMYSTDTDGTYVVFLMNEAPSKNQC